MEHLVDSKGIKEIQDHPEHRDFRDFQEMMDWMDLLDRKAILELQAHKDLLGNKVNQDPKAIEVTLDFLANQASQVELVPQDLLDQVVQREIREIQDPLARLDHQVEGHNLQEQQVYLELLGLQGPQGYQDFQETQVG
jgi:hypothetical protein